MLLISQAREWKIVMSDMFAICCLEDDEFFSFTNNVIIFTDLLQKNASHFTTLKDTRTPMKILKKQTQNI
jgi:hypothetical protein